MPRLKKSKKRKNSPKKEGTEDHNSKKFRLCASTFFLTYKGITQEGEAITKPDLANFLFNDNPHERTSNINPTIYIISQQTYASGEPHFHVILKYQRRKDITSESYYDYKGIHPNIQKMRNLKAALIYMYKEDPSPYSNTDIESLTKIELAKKTTSLYQLLEQQMKKRPYTFDVDQYLLKHNLFKQVIKTNYTRAVSLVKCAHTAYVRSLMSDKPGIKLITPQLIAERLSEDQVKEYYSHPCYARIVEHINQIHIYPNRDVQTMAPSKTPHLLIVGDASIGKSALVDHRANKKYPYPGLMHYYSCYHMSIGEKFFPPYKSFDYRMVRWNEFTIVSDLFPKKAYHRLLDYLEGAPSAIPQKGRPAVQRQDNPKHILTSNLTLQRHINIAFTSASNRALARRNIGTRIDCVQIPLGKEIHFLRKLFVSLAQ